MNEFIQMPDVNELKDELTTARADIQEAINEEPELENESKFLLEVLAVLEEKIASEKDLSSLSKKDQIAVLAHLNLFYTLLEDMFGDDFEDFEDEDFEDEDFEDEETQEE